MPLDAPPPTAPASCTCGLDAHTVWSAPPCTVAAGLIAIVIWSLTWGQVPAAPTLLSVSVTLPAAISAAVGVYVAFKAAALGLNVPAPPLHVPPVAPPPTAPASCACG